MRMPARDVQGAAAGVTARRGAACGTLPRMSLVRAVNLGALGGLVATAAMSVVMLAAREGGLMGRLPPHEIASKTVARTGLSDDVDADGREAAGWAGHLAFGAIAGALFAGLRALLRPPGSGVVHGVLFALGVWLVSYQGWIPALRLLPPASRDHPERPAAMVAAHVVYGTVLGAIAGRGSRATET